MSSLERKGAVLSGAGVGTIVRNAYGKSAVRLTKVTRLPDRHDLKELCVDVQLEGDFEEHFTKGDNTTVVATDSMRNTIYVLAAKNEFDDIESFGKILSSHFLNRYPHVHVATVSIKEDLWQRVILDGKPHPHAFWGAGIEKRFCEVTATRKAVVVYSGIDDLRVVKTTDSAFTGFIRDEFTTLPEVEDRIFGTTVSSRWSYATESCDYNDCYNKIWRAIMDTFATHVSDSVQQTLHEAGLAALTQCPAITEITLTMPNQHRIPFNLVPFGLENRNEIFVNTSEPYGLISATVARAG